MKIGTPVMLVGTDGLYMPPMGATGVIVGALDWLGDHEVEFPDYPCAVGEDTWEIPAQWLMPLDGSQELAGDSYSKVSKTDSNAMQTIALESR